MATDPTVAVDDGITVFEARFGDKNGALALLQSPSELREFFLRLSYKADLPDSPPAGVTWRPFVRGWSDDGYYLIALTSPDTDAVRPGMVATRMLAVLIDDIEVFDGLAVLFDDLQNAVQVQEYVPRRTVPRLSESATSSVNPALLNCIAHHLIHSSRPAAILGQEGFEDTVDAFWRLLPRHLRRSFAFGFSFTPSDLSASQASVVAVPQSCEPRWSGYENQCTRLSKNAPKSSAVSVLLRKPEVGRFWDFLDEVKLEIRSFDDYSRFVRVWENWEKRHDSQADISFSLVRDLGTLIPTVEKAADQKKESLQIVATWLSRSGATEILAQRSVKATAFPNNAIIIGEAIAHWVEVQFSPTPTVSISDVARVVLAMESSQSLQWKSWVSDGIEQALSSLNERVAHLLWELFSISGCFDALAERLPNDSGTERLLVSTHPEVISSHLYDSVKSFCVTRRWLGLLGTSTRIYRSFDDAISLVFDQSGKKGKRSAVKLLCNAATALDVWQAAFKYDDATITDCAVSASLDNPDFWIRDIQNYDRWVTLLELAAVNGGGFLKDVDVDTVRENLYHGWGQGIPVKASVLDALEQVDCLEVLRASNRDQLWDKIPDSYLGRVRNNTIREWLKVYYSKLATELELEEELLQVLFESQNLEFTFPRESQLICERGFQLVQKWGSETQCELWLHAVVSSSSHFAERFAKEVGSVVAERRWRTVARNAQYYDYHWKRHDVWPIWRAYYDPLYAWEKIAFDWSPSTSIQDSFTPQSEHKRLMIDAIFVTALTEEFRAALAHLRDVHERVEGGTIYKVGRFTGFGKDCTVAVLVTGMGNAQSAAATERALTFFEPQFAFFVGIAGGLRDDLEIGDVIIADKVYGYESGKAGTSFRTRPEATTVSHETTQRANSIVMDDVWQNRIASSQGRRPKALVKPIAAGEKVVASKGSTEFKRLRNTYSDAHAVAMEEQGFCVSVKLHPSVCFAVVRGISDLIEGKEEADATGSHDIAAQNASACAFELLAGLLRGRNAINDELPPFKD